MQREKGWAFREGRRTGFRAEVGNRRRKAPEPGEGRSSQWVQEPKPRLQFRFWDFG